VTPATCEPAPATGPAGAGYPAPTMAAVMSTSRGPAALAALAALAIGGCSSPDQLECVDVDLACQPLYAPTWDNAFNTTFAPKCGTGGSSCHGGANPHGGLDLEDPGVAYQSLTAPTKSYVIPGEPSCSELIERIMASSSRLVMPRGSRLSAAEQCSLVLWVAGGAPGPADAATDAATDGGDLDAGVDAPSSDAPGPDA